MIQSTNAPNRLINEKSPYLLQHARNPVDWYPWGDEAFDRAEREDKPVFISIGYSSCHWCHVMERESFENERVAALLNRDFVCVKVDREERPDVDQVYMNACVAQTGSGGWPLSVFTAPDRRPFFAGTYFPMEDAFGRTGFISLVNRIAHLWKTDRDRLLSLAGELTAATEESHVEGSFEDIISAPDKATDYFLRTYDSKYGGFGISPKFPSPHTLMFLMRMEDKKNGCLRAALGTLDGMAAGGMHDHIGGGFCRYSTDRMWLVPHFEKMAYDNALLAMAYTEAFEITARKEYSRVVEDTLGFMLKEMSDEGGGFYTAQDADSPEGEGSFYIWSPDEVNDVLGEKDGREFCRIFNITKEGNFEGKSIPNLIGTAVPEGMEEWAKSMKRSLYMKRLERPRPMTDKKVLLSNTALMACVLARAGRVFEKPEYTEAARKAASFALKKMIDHDHPTAVWDGEKAAKPATLDSVSYLLWAMVELYESSREPAWLGRALEICDIIFDLFSGENGGLYYSSSRVSDLPSRPINASDSALPSGQSVVANNLVRLARLTGRFELEQMAQRLITSIWQDISHAPAGYAWALAAVEYIKRGGRDIVITEGEGREELLGEIKGFMPFNTLTLSGSPELTKLAPFLEDMTARNGRAAAYVCRHGACARPVGTAGELRKLLRD